MWNLNNRFRTFASLAALLVLPAQALAQALPDTVRAAGVTVAQWQAVQAEVRRVAAERGASESALQAVAVRVSANLVQNGHVDIDRLLQSLDDRAQQIVDLQGQLATMIDDPAVAQLRRQAGAAIDSGDLSLADQLLSQSAQSDLARIAQAEALARTSRTRAAETTSQRAQLAELSGRYSDAASFYAMAATMAPAGDLVSLWRYRQGQALALGSAREALTLTAEEAATPHVRAWQDARRRISEISQQIASATGAASEAERIEDLTAARATAVDELHSREALG